MQSWVLLDFGDAGLDVVESSRLDYPDKSLLCNENFDFSDPCAVYTAAGSSKKRYKSTVLRFGGK